jgi:hypothetical protein
MCQHSTARCLFAFALRRESVTPADSNAAIGAMLEGVTDFRYAKSRAQLDAWVRGDR